MQIVLIVNKNGFKLWSYGNYQYQIEYPSGVKYDFESSYELALDRFERVINQSNQEK